MGKISNVFYTTIPEEKCSLIEAGSFYFYYNLMNISPEIIADYERYEEHQMILRNDTLGEAFSNGNIPRHPKVDTSIFGISTLKNRPILVTEY